MIIRREERRDWAEVENLTREAFWNVYRPGCLEHYILHELRRDSSFIPELDYVIEDGGIVASIVYAMGTLERADKTQMPLALFGPVCVRPDVQGRGYGSAIIRHTLSLAAKMGLPAVTITGNAAYYHRFGFESASKHGIYYPDTEPSDEAAFFMVKVLDADRMGDIKGIFREPAVYDPPMDAVEAFDRGFPPKKKEIRPGQL